VENPALVAAVSVLLMAGSFFFVASEYALVSSRRSRLEGAAKKGDKAAGRVLNALERIGPLVAATQIGITMVGIGLGSVTEPFVSEALARVLGAAAPKALSLAISYLLITYLVVVLGELLPKYLVLQMPEAVARLTVAPISFIAKILSPLVWLAQASATILLKPLGVDIGAAKDSFEKDELLMLVKSGQAGGALEQTHAEFITRALKLDALTARDIMIHRLDMKWLDVATPAELLLSRMSEIPHSRVPVCKGDIDDVVGIAYLHDLVKASTKGNIRIEDILRQPVMVPENLTLDRIVSLMREERTQIVIVMDEYGGTSGLITLEDVVEEVFGELEDSLEGERPVVEIHGSRVTAKANVRFDELIGRLGIELAEEPVTDTLAEMIVDTIQSVPKIGDSIQTPIGTMRVDNMARRRITRVSISLDERSKRVDRGS